MTINTKSGKGLLLKPAEELVPYNNWLPWLKGFAIECVKKNHLPIYVGNSYTAEDFWMVLISHALFNVSLDEASDCLDEIRWEEENSHRRNKISPQEYKGKIKRRERKSPNGDQTRKYRNSLPDWLVKKLNTYIFEQQIDYALKEKLITKNIDVIGDNTDKWYYGSDRYPNNPFITRGNKGPGTSRKRNFLGLMIKSGSTYLYCGVDIIKKKHSNVPFILETLDWLTKKGFNIRYFIGDRGFPTVELLKELPSRGIDYVGPYKKYAPVRRKVEKYIKWGGKYIISHTINKIKVWLILTNGQGRRLREIRMDYKRKLKSLAQCVKEIMVMLTTVKPPAGKKKRQGWAVQICRIYKHRWQIETGFRDINRISPPSNARTNARKVFMCSVRYWIYNAWQLERAKRKKLRSCPKSWKKGPTLRRFTHCAIKIGVCV